MSFDEAEYDDSAGLLRVFGRDRCGWIIDGQHRAAGAHTAANEGINIEFLVIAFLQAPIRDQIELFVTINREAKGVPASLYLDLRGDLPRKKTEKEILDARLTDIAHQLNQDEAGPFSGRLIFTRIARTGEISVVNFARVLRPLLAKASGGALAMYTALEQERVISNYYQSLLTTFPAADRKDVFFRTVGFGGVWRAFPIVFTAAQQKYKAFNVISIIKVLKEIEDFNFENWLQYGTGSAAEVNAGDDMITALQEAFEHDEVATLKLD